MVILWTVFVLWHFLFYEDVKTCRTLVSQKNAEDFTTNIFLKCAQVKRLKGITFSYEHEKTVD